MSASEEGPIANLPHERNSLLLLIILGLVPRLIFIARFPTIPTSDFRSIMAFSQELYNHGLISKGWFWEYLNPGLPLFLSGLFHIFPGVDPTDVARLATAFACGLMPALPFLIWRGVLPLWTRLLAGCALAVWPGQILFSGVVAQDNWVLLPSIALAALAVSSLLDSRRARPVIAGLLYVAGAAVRQEMLVALFPLFLAAAGIINFRPGWRRVAAAGLAVVLPLVALAAYRDVCTGRFSLSTEHSGLSLLGAFIPGSSVNGWTDASPFVASVRPDLLNDRKALLAETRYLAVHEALRRPAFHTARILSSVFSAAVAGEEISLYWSIGASEVLPKPLGTHGSAVAALAGRSLHVELAVIQALFLAAVIVGIRRQNMAILVLASAVLLKYGIHAVTVAQGRYFFVATALEILAITVAAYEVRTMDLPGRWLVTRALAPGVAFGLGLFLFAPSLAAFVRSRDVDDQHRVYHFPLESDDRRATLTCVVDHGLLAALSEFPWSATIRTLQSNPAPGEKAVAVCDLTGSGEPRPATLQVFDPYAPGGLGGRMVQRVEIDGNEVFSQDVARDPGSGWANIPLGNVGSGTQKRVVIEVKAIHPDPGASWGDNARTEFRLTASSSIPHLAVGRPASQSSILSDRASARAAVDGNTDGNFYNGSVSHTNLESNAWWQVDLGSSVPIGSIVVWNRTDCCGGRLDDYWMFVSNIPFSPTDTPATLKNRAGTWSSHQTAVPNPSTKITGSTPGRYVRVQLSGTNYLSLAEVQVFGK